MEEENRISGTKAVGQIQVGTVQAGGTGLDRRGPSMLEQEDPDMPFADVVSPFSAPSALSLSAHIG